MVNKNKELELTVSRYTTLNNLFLYKKTLSYLTAVDDKVSENLDLYTVPQVGVLFSINQKMFLPENLDHNLLNFLGGFRDRCFLVFEKSTKKSLDGTSIRIHSLLRVTVSDTSPEERSKIVSFMADNLDKYPTFIRLVTDINYAINFNELLININRSSKIFNSPNRKDYKSIALIYNNKK
jgi:hypothetical protein